VSNVVLNLTEFHCSSVKNKRKSVASKTTLGPIDFHCKGKISWFGTT